MTELRVYYDDRMVAHQRSMSPSSFKPKLVVEDWLKTRGDDIKIVSPIPAVPAELTLAHSHAYVGSILSLREDNGFGERSQEVADSLLWTVGAMLDATQYALETGANTCAPVSGFHHAGYDFAGGFCTFNGLMVAARRPSKRFRVDTRVGILDCDMHYGDGTDDIIGEIFGPACVKNYEVDAKGFIHASASDAPIRHYSLGRHYKNKRDAKRFLERLPSVVQAMHDCSVVLYQAGADPHVDDPLGGMLTSEDLRLRDRIVFRELRKLRVPVVWNLAGGYRKDAQGGITPVIETHRATLEECLAAMNP